MIMYDFKRILVCLDLSDQDKYLIQMAANFIKLGIADSIYFIFVSRELELSEEIVTKYPTLVAPPDESLLRIMKDELDQYFDADLDKCDLLVSEGSRFDEILKWSRVKLIDLVIMGKKPAEIASFELPEKIIKFTHTSVLLVPAFEIKPLSKLLVPIDFSENSSLALNQAVKIQELLGSEIICQNIYRVPSGYHTTGKSYEEFAEIMKVNAGKEFLEFLESHNLKDSGITCVYSLEKGNAAEQIHEIAEELQVDGIVMGSKGRTTMSNLILGSTSMKMVKHEFQIPVLIVKDKEHNLDFVEAIMKI
jgi:nucleotide-binding universal stress UspA family protein